MASITALAPPAAPPAAPCRDGTPLRHRSARWLLVPVVVAGAGVGVLTALGPEKALAGLIAVALAACIWKWPQLAAYLVVGLTPLTVGISRGAALPVVRPNEAIALLAGGTLAVRGLVRMRTGRLPRFRLDRVELAIILMAVANSGVVLLWMALRQQQISTDDVLYALVLWKLLGLYFLVRFSVRTDRQVLRCLWISLAAACVVAVLAILQSLGVAGVPGILNSFYASGLATSGLETGRGSSTLGLPAATADLMVFSLAIVAGMWTRLRAQKIVLAAAAVLFLMGALSAAEFSSAIGLVAGIICIAIVLRKPRLLYVFVPGLLLAGLALRSVIAVRLSGFQSAAGLPTSWTGRLQNLQTYFWPTLFSHGNFLLGVRPAARIVVPTQVTGYVWIESGYTWLLWGGGIPLLLSFVFFVYVTARRGWDAANGAAPDEPGRSVAGVAVFAAIFVITVLMTFDPHLTYRGSADQFFFLLALAAPVRARASGAPLTQKTLLARGATSRSPPAETMKTEVRR